MGYQRRFHLRRQTHHLYAGCECAKVYAVVEPREDQEAADQSKDYTQQHETNRLGDHLSNDDSRSHTNCTE